MDTLFGLLGANSYSLYNQGQEDEVGEGEPEAARQQEQAGEGAETVHRPLHVMQQNKVDIILYIFILKLRLYVNQFGKVLRSKSRIFEVELVSRGIGRQMHARRTFLPQF